MSGPTTEPPSIVLCRDSSCFHIELIWFCAYNHGNRIQIIHEYTTSQELVMAYTSIYDIVLKRWLANLVSPYTCLHYHTAMAPQHPHVIRDQTVHVHTRLHTITYSTRSPFKGYTRSSSVWCWLVCPYLYIVAMPPSHSIHFSYQ